MIGALAFASALTACGDSGQEAGAGDGTWPASSDSATQSSDPTSEEEGAHETSSGRSPISVKALDEHAVDGLCTELLGDVSDVAAKVGLSEYVAPEDYGKWQDSFREEVGHSTLGCHATSLSGSSDGMHIFVTSALASPRGVEIAVSARSETNEAAFNFQFERVESAHERAELSESGDIQRFLEEDVLPHFQS